MHTPFDYSCHYPSARLPVFARNLTQAEQDAANKVPLSSLRDPQTLAERTKEGHANWLITLGVCTHLGCIPIPYLGNYKGWVCICHGSVYDKFGRVRQGPALENLRIINNSLYNDILCIEELKYPREPTTRFWA